MRILVIGSILGERRRPWNVRDVAARGIEDPETWLVYA
jgi:hypothetical protein